MEGLKGKTMYQIKKTEAEIDEQVNAAHEGRDDGGKFPGMTYEDGVLAMLDWLTSDGDEAPMSE